MKCLKNILDIRIHHFFANEVIRKALYENPNNVINIIDKNP